MGSLVCAGDPQVFDGAVHKAQLSQGFRGCLALPRAAAALGEVLVQV